ncbi:MAG TPA: acyl carrier protein [Methylomirabilota bacterium]|jgi:acyl carrier protein|nr:acyl carrier protein [Methylomirabilota bacterium]
MATTTTNDVEGRVKKILQARLGLPEEALRSEARLVEDLEMDSLDSVELAIQMEKEFNIGIGEDLLTEITTVADIVALIEELSGARAEA